MCIIMRLRRRIIMRVPRSGTRISHMCMRAARAMLGKARAPGPEGLAGGYISRLHSNNGAY